MLADGRYVGDGFPWMSDADRASYATLDEEFGKLAASVDPEDPWSHPEADRLDSLSMAAWLRDRGATPNVVRARDLAMLALSAESIERTSLLAELRKEAAAGGNGFYNYEIWECNRVAEGSAMVALRMAEELGPPRALRHPGHPHTGLAAGLHRHDGDRGALRVGCRGLRAAGGPAAPRASRGRLGRAHGLARPPATCPRRQGGVHLRGLLLARPGPERRLLLRDRRDRRDLGPARGDHVHARPPGAPRCLPHHLAGPARVRAHRGDGGGLRRARPATRRRSSSAAGASTPGRAATSPAGGRAT